MKRLLLLTPVVSLAACATTAPNYDPLLPGDPTLHPVSSAVIYEDTLPERARGIDVPIDYTAANQAALNAAYANPAVSPGAAAAGGVIGVLLVAAIDASVDANRNNRINEMIDEQGFEAEAVFNTRLADQIASIGMALETRAGERDEDGNRVDEAAIATDAVIDVSVRDYGFIVSVGGWTPYVNANLVMTDAQTGDILVEESIVVGSNGYGGRNIVPPMDPRYANLPLDAYLEDNPAMAIEALRFALEITADAAAQALVGEVAVEGEDS